MVSNHPTLRKSLINAGILLVYFGIAIGITWPLAAHITTHLPGGSQDTLVHYWNGWWVKQALTTGQSPYHTSYLYYPTGMSLVYHNFAWISIVTWLMLEPLVGGFVAYNLSIFINLALCGLGAFLLAYELTGDRRAAFLAGLIYQCWPYRLSQLDHPNLISTQWIPLLLLFLIRALRRGKWRDGALAGAFLALTGYTRWQLLVPAGILGAIYLLSVLPDRIASWRRWLPALLIAGAIAAAALAPPVSLLFNQQRSAPADLLREDEEINMQSDVLAYVTPSRSHTVLKSLTKPAYDRYYADRYQDRRFAAYVGATALALSLLGVYKLRRASLPWVAMALVLILLALGPVLRFNGQTYPAVPMPYRLAARLYIVRLLRVPDRFNMFLALPIAVLAAHGAAHVLALARRRGRWIARAAPYLLGGIILLEYVTIPAPLRYPHQSQFYQQLYAEPGEFAVLNLPISAVASKRYMFAQITHQKPIVQGKTPRFPEGTFDYINDHPWLQTPRQYSTMPPVHDDVSRQLATLAQDNIRYIILHQDITNPLLRMSQWRHYFLISPQFEDDNILVYPTTPLAGRDFDLAHELAPGIGPIRIVTSTACLNPGQPLGIEVGWGTEAAPGRDLNVRLALAAEDGTVRYEQTLPLSTNWPTREWPANAVAWEHYTLDTPPSFPSGDYTATLALVDAATGATLGPAAPAGQVTVSDGNCTFPIPSDAIGVNALFGNELRLMGYQLNHSGDQLTLTLHWRSERLMETDYKIFVHVFDPETGLRVAQDDSMPLRWTYPTTYWSAGDAVADEIPLSLEQAPPGSYRVAVGVYDPTTGERLPVMDRAGQLQPDGQVLLPGDLIELE